MKVHGNCPKRERRKRNLVWFGVPECPTTQVEKRVAADRVFLIDVCHRALDLKLEVDACKRLCLKQVKNTSTTSTPLLVTVKSSKQISQVLKAARKLRDSTEFKAIFVKKDSTPLERAEIKKLLEDRDKKRQETKKKGGNENWIVRQGRVVNTTRRQQEETTASQSDVTVSQEAIVDGQTEALVASHQEKEYKVIQVCLYTRL